MRRLATRCNILNAWVETLKISLDLLCFCVPQSQSMLGGIRSLLVRSQLELPVIRNRCDSGNGTRVAVVVAMVAAVCHCGAALPPANTGVMVMHGFMFMHGRYSILDTYSRYRYLAPDHPLAPSCYEVEEQTSIIYSIFLSVVFSSAICLEREW